MFPEFFWVLVLAAFYLVPAGLYTRFKVAHPMDFMPIEWAFVPFLNWLVLLIGFVIHHYDPYTEVSEE